MRIRFMLAAVLALGSSASAAERGRLAAILVSPIHEAQIVRADDGKDHVEYELLVVNVFSEPVMLASVTVFDPAGKELVLIEGGALAAATQTLFAKTATPVVPASAAVSVDVDLILQPDTAPERVTHRIAYTLKVDSKLAATTVRLTHSGRSATQSLTAVRVGRLNSGEPDCREQLACRHQAASRFFRSSSSTRRH